MELEQMKKLVNRYLVKHREMVRESKAAERYYKKQNDILKYGVRVSGESKSPLHSKRQIRTCSEIYGVLL